MTDRIPPDAPLEHGHRHGPLEVPGRDEGHEIQVEFDRLAWAANTKGIGQE